MLPFAGRRRREAITFAGDYPSWSAALADATGYDAQVILERTRAALLKVKRGEAAYERDSVVFDEVQHSFPVLAGLLRAAIGGQGRLSVLDFGGALGSSYFQCRAFLRPLKKLEWLVVEQPSHVACGRKDFATEELRFYETVEACMSRHQPDLLLLSSVLQYLPEPYGMLDRLLRLGLSYVLIDRTAFLESDRERLTLQTVPPTLYPASYPAWFFSETRFTNAIQDAGYKLVADFPGADAVAPKDEAAYFKGFIFEQGTTA
jgi:putative methyltransferase (TIGR04325 family)